MSEQAVSRWSEAIAGLQSEDVLRAAMRRVADDLSVMLGRPISVDVPKIEKVPIADVTAYAGGPETGMVGIYLLIDGKVHAQAILMLPLDDAPHLVDLLMGLPLGTTRELGDLERSALGELGNVTVSSFLNAVAALTETPARPSPPAVVVDMLGAILDVVIAPVATEHDELLIAETAFRDSGRVVQTRFWVLPDPRPGQVPERATVRIEA